MTKLNREIQAVQLCLKLALDLELQIPTKGESVFSSPVLTTQLHELKTSLKLLGEFQNPSLNKLSKIADHLTEKMRAKHFSNFIIPLERFLNRSLRDDDFLISSHDLSEIPPRRPIVFILENIRSAFNVGSIIRLADCVGASQVVLCGYTPGLVKDTINPTVLKTSLNAANYLKLAQKQNVEEVVKELKNEKFNIIALETSKNSKSIYESPINGPTAFLVGNERFGLDSSTLSLVDEVRHIPMFGVKNSLNVSNALTAAAFEWSRQNP